jgi:hypothetical protein
MQEIDACLCPSDKQAFLLSTFGAYRKGFASISPSISPLVR